MAQTATTGPAAFQGVVDKIALELVFAEPGKDNGLLPINCLLGELEEIQKASPFPNPVPQGLVLVRQWVDQVFETGTFTPASLERLRNWLTWAQAAGPCMETNQPIPAVPSAETTPASTAGTPTAPGTAAPAEEESFVLNIEGDGELLREFTNESHEHFQNIEQGVLSLEENPTDADTLNSIFRAFHTFKGGSGFLNLRPINRLAHELESLLDLARQHKLVIDLEIINIILSGGDTLSQFVKEIESRLSGNNPAQPIQIPIQRLLSRVRAVVEGGPKPATIAAPAPAPAPLAILPPTAAAPPSVTPPTPAPPHPDSAAPQTATAKPADGGAPRASSGATAVKVDTLKLDSLIDLVGEIVIAQTMVAQDPDLCALQSRQLARNMAQLGRITKELQRISMSLRMVPVRATFQKMTRLVRDLSFKASKQVELTMTGEETELDRNIVEEISDPLVHMIRNSVDHGIEKTETRVAQGKTPYGSVHLAAYHQGGNIVLEIKDDGAGLNRERLLKKAIEKGIIRPGDNLSDKEIYGLIFAAGFSTADKVTDISGRGVGMDVVRRNVEKLRGKIEIETVLGKGTKFSIFLPLTLAIIDGLIVSVGGERYIVPTLSVRESFRPTREMLSTVHERGEMVNVRGRLLPLLRLHALFNVTPRSTDPTQGILVVVESDTRTCCLLVDQLLGKQEVVIKSLGETFKGNPGLAGAAILGDGRVGLIVDNAGLMKLNAMPLQKAA